MPRYSFEYMYTDFFEPWMLLYSPCPCASLKSAWLTCRSVTEEMNPQFLADSAEEADFVVLEHCVTYAYHVLR